MSLRTAFLNPSTGILRSGWRIPLLALCTYPLIVGQGLLTRAILPHLPPGAFLPVKTLSSLAAILLPLLVYRWFARKVERREPVELGFGPGTLRHVGLGLLAGGGAMAIITAILAASGAYQIVGSHGAWTLARALIFYPAQTFVEDFLFCLVIYRLLREGLGAKAALVIAPLLFAAAHAGNPNESPLGMLEIFTAGFLMYSLFERTGSFWSVWALHFSWNFTMNGLFGMANSGQDIPGYFKSRITGPTWLTGGVTGPEASVLALGLDVAFIALIWSLSKARLRPQAR